jgi:calcineurin-like phosphoesterase family protein
MHPEFKSELNYVWIYPSEFDIIYYTNGTENLNIHKHTSCVLESMSVNYTPNGNFSVFANGMPTQINVSLSFRELQLASKETIGLTPGGL